MEIRHEIRHEAPAGGGTGWQAALQGEVVGAGLAGLLLLSALPGGGGERPALAWLGFGLGFALYKAAFGFAAAWRHAFLEREISGVAAQLLMLGVASVLFAPILAGGTALGRPVTGAVAPVDTGLLVGAFLFGVGMQLARGCASGTLFTAGGGSPRMWLVLVLFCAGGFLASLHLGWWRSLPGLGSHTLATWLGPWGAAGTTGLVLLGTWLLLLALGGRQTRPLWRPPGLRPGRGAGGTLALAVLGPWPLAWGALALAALNALTVLVAGHPWSITWGFTLWAAKAALALGWDPSGSAFWGDGFPARALAAPVLADATSVMNLGILLGALVAAGLAGRFHPRAALRGERPRAWLAAVAGGLLLGYGARLAYGCNIGAFFSGVASGSLHGWVWVLPALAGNLAGLRMRPWFHMP